MRQICRSKGRISWKLKRETAKSISSHRLIRESLPQNNYSFSTDTSRTAIKLALLQVKMEKGTSHSNLCTSARQSTPSNENPANPTTPGSNLFNSTKDD